MKLFTRITFLAGALALVAASAALATGPTGPGYAEPPGPKAGMPEKARAYGRYCRHESRKHVKGEKGTAFSRCVTNMAQAATHPNMAPGQACKGESRKHVKGEKGTAFSRCVKAEAKLRRHEHEEAATS